MFVVFKYTTELSFDMFDFYLFRCPIKKQTAMEGFMREVKVLKQSVSDGKEKTSDDKEKVVVVFPARTLSVTNIYCLLMVSPH